MVAMAMFANIATAGGGETVGVKLHRDGIGPMIPDDFGGDFRAGPHCGKERVDIRSGFLTGYTRPLALDRPLKLCEFCVSHTDGPGLWVTASVDFAMVSHSCTGALPKCDQSPLHAVGECCCIPVSSHGRASGSILLDAVHALHHEALGQT